MKDSQIDTECVPPAAYLLTHDDFHSLDASNVGFICFTVGCALSPNLGALIVFRFLAGCFGATPVSNGAGTVGDLIPQEKRGRAMSIYLLGPLVGPIAGPIIGGVC